MEPVVVSRGVSGPPPREARLAPRAPAACRPAGERPPDAPRQPERLAVLTALALAVVTSTLSLGFVVAGSNGPDGAMVQVWPPGSEVERLPAMGDVTASHRPHAIALALNDGPTRRTTRDAGDVPPPRPARSPEPPPAPPVPETPDAKADVPPASTAAEAPPAPRNIRVRERNGKTVIARVHGGSGDSLHIVLPDGQLGIPDRPAFTDEPFRPATFDEVERDLLDGPFSGFKSLRLPHYLIVYQSSEEFARKSGNVLEKLYKGLTDAFRKFEVPVRDAEFPLVAVIFPTEEAFRAFRAVDPEIQAYYEIYSNRIFFYETSDRDEQAPEIAALRRPQTVAHEGTHQILQNTGIHPRLAPWPPWLIEGLAEYCATPVMSRKGVTNWSGLGVVNATHLATIRDLDDPLNGQVAGSVRPVHIGRKPGQPLVEYLVTKTELTPTDYALAWALTHYLAKRRVESFVAYLKAMGELAPLSKRTPAEQLDAFRRAFGKDLAKLDREIHTYLGKLKGNNHLPYYAVVFRQRVGGGLERRAAIVSQSPSMIRQWLQSVTTPRGDVPVWEAYPFPNRNPALVAAESWVRGQ